MGVAVIVFMSALLGGVQANIFDRLISTQAHIVISAPDDAVRVLRTASSPDFAILQRPLQRVRSVDQWQGIAKNLRQRSSVIAVSPIASGSAFAMRGDASMGVSMIGIDAVEYVKIVALPEKMIGGTADLAPGDILIGKQLATELGVRLDEKLRLRVSGGGGIDTEETFTISGIFDFGDKGTNLSSVYVPLRAAQSLLAIPGGVTSLNVNLEDAYQAETVAAELRDASGLNAESWIMAFNDLFTALRSQNISFYSIEFFVAVAVSLGIASVLVVSVVQRKREIGILRAMGASRGQVLRIFLVQGALIGLIGSIIGSGVAVGFVWLWRLLARNADGTPFFAIPLSPMLFLITGISATILGIATAFLPALGAARLNPVDAIRG